MFYFYCLLLCSPLYPVIAARSWAQDSHSLHVANIASKPVSNEKIHAQEHCETSDHQYEHTGWAPDAASQQPLRHSLEARADQEHAEMLQPLTTNQLVARNKEISDLAVRFKKSRNGKALIEIVTRLVTTESIRIQNCVVIALGPVGQLKNSKEQLAAFEVLFDVIRNKEHWLGNNHVYFTDPEFNAVDKAILRSRGYQVLENQGDVQRYISVNTFLFAAFAPINVDIARSTISPPSLYLGTSALMWLHMLDNQRTIQEQQSIEIGIQKLRLTEFSRGREHHDLFLEPGVFRGMQGFMSLVWKVHARPEAKDRTDMVIDRILEAWTNNEELAITRQEESAIFSKLKAARIRPFLQCNVSQPPEWCVR